MVSPMARARRTAELAGPADQQVVPDLMEWQYGGCEGVTTAEILRGSGLSAGSRLTTAP